MHSIALASTTIYGWCVTQLVYNTMLLFSNWNWSSLRLSTVSIFVGIKRPSRYTRYICLHLFLVRNPLMNVCHFDMIHTLFSFLVFLYRYNGWFSRLNCVRLVIFGTIIAFVWCEQKFRVDGRILTYLLLSMNTPFVCMQWLNI